MLHIFIYYNFVNLVKNILNVLFCVIEFAILL
jgi:hypothetical protein